MAARPTHPADEPGLALAMVVSSVAPLVLLDGDLKVVAASASFCRTFDIDPASAPGRELLALGGGEWNVPQLGSLMRATASGDAEIEAYEMDLEREGRETRRLVINVQRLRYDDGGDLRLLMAVADVTDARLAERRTRDVLRENEILIQEVRHRVANSLQIIASVLMQNARRAKSEETRGHLRDAHQRVLSVADLQQQLAASTLGTVQLRTYLTKLCDSITASMIPDPEALVLEVTAEDVIIDAGISVSLGLIVTELVINALKHGFPDGRRGRITVGYHAAGLGWVLSVSDDGVGMPREPRPTVGGLGSSIVEALAKQLQARVEVEARRPGTRVSIVHSAALNALRPANVIRAV